MRNSCVIGGTFLLIVVVLSTSIHVVHAFNVAETTIAQIHAELDSGRLTCQQVIQLHLNRISAFDQAGPKLNSVIMINPQVLQQAKALDQAGRQGRSLFCIPIALKDNVDMVGYPTAAGSLALNSTIPTSNAILLQRMLDAGALVIAKVNMAELAMDGMNSNSSLGGQTLNPYNLQVSPMGSSGGTGVAIAASLAVIGIGSDTNGSIQNPSNVNSIVGLRSTHGLISSVGVFPLLDWQDVAGPMTRTVEDLARVMDVIDGGSTFSRPNVSYSEYLDSKALRGVRIAFLEQTITPASVPIATIPDPEVVKNARQVVNELMQAGASVISISPNATTAFKNFFTVNSVNPDYLRCAWAEQRNSWDYYWKTRTPTSPIKDVKQLITAIDTTPGEQEDIAKTLKIIATAAAPNCTSLPAVGCIRYKETQEQVARYLEWALEYYQVDALLYVPMNQPSPPLGNIPEGFMSFSLLSAISGMPAIVFPSGVTTSGIPLGMTLLSRNWSEVRLIRYAYAYEKMFNKRIVPPTTPPL